MGGRVRIVCAFLAVAAGGAASCGGRVSSGTPFSYQVVAELDTSRGTEVLDFETVLVCDKWSGVSCVKTSNDAPGARTAVDLVSDGCRCAGAYSFDFSGSAVSALVERVVFSSSVAAPGGVADSGNGLLTIVSSASQCTGSVRVTKADRLASDTPGCSYPDIAGVFEISCPGFKLENGLFYLNPQEIELGLPR